MKRYLPFVIIALVALLTVGIAAAVYQVKMRPISLQTASSSSSMTPMSASETAASATSTSASGATAASAPDTTPLIIDPGSGLPTPNPAPATPLLHARGPSDAPVTLEIYGDFQCPACAINARFIDELQKANQDKLRVVFHEFPLAMHNHSVEAAEAAEAAGLQGKFWEMHDTLYKTQDSWSKVSRPSVFFAAYARSIGLDVDRFRSDYESGAVRARVQADGEAGQARGVRNTPTIFVNGEEVRAIFSKEKLQEAIDAALATKKKS